jgi:hypothetical protein
MASRQPTHQGELAAMVYAMRDDHVPQDLPNQKRLPPEEGDRTIEILRLQLADPTDSLLVNPFIGMRHLHVKTSPLLAAI